MLVPTLSPAHHRDTTERTAGPILKLVEVLSATYLSDNVVRRATKV